MRIPALCILPDRSLQKAELAAKFISDTRRADEAFTAALLLNIGQIVLARCCGKNYFAVVDEAAASRRPLQEVEQEMLGVTHAEVGAYLLGIWGLPPALVEIVACHHAPSLLTLTPGPLIDAVHIADAMVDALDAGLEDPTEAIDAQYRQRPELAARLSEWKETAEASMRAA
jgi:HD-like signal output (HDOD) protein